MDPAMKCDILESCASRAEFYRFLASLYKLELTAEQIEVVAKASLPCDDTIIGRGYMLIAEYLRHRDSATRQELAVDYAHTFLCAGSYDKIIAPPYESVYTSEDHMLMQDARDGAVAFYRSEGLDLPSDNTTPEDHVSFEMQFMATLIERSAKALQESDDVRFINLFDKQQSFLEQHLANWLPAFIRDIRLHARTDFYRGVADLTEGLLEEERAVLDELICLGKTEAA